MLRIENIKKQFGNTIALDDVSLNIDPGEFFGLLGPNGAGKTTLINIIVGYLKPDSGNIYYRDKKLVFNDPRTRMKFGYVPQEISLYLELSASVNLKIFGSLYGVTGKELSKSIDRVLELVQLKDRRSEPVKNFSGGMKRRLNLAVGLLHDPELLLCDEPTVGVDPQSRNAIFELLRELSRKKVTVIYTTHHMEEAERLCHRLAIIDYGKIIAEGSLRDLINLLDKKETVKIKKHAGLESKINPLSELGVLNESDHFFELIPVSKVKKTSDIFLFLERLNIDSEFVELSRASLEDVFLQLTGRSLRD